jgi:DNA-binding NarL/FixJ family response regulator
MLDDGAFDVVGSVDDGESAVEAVRQLRPDLVLLDVQLPGIDGFEVAEQVSREPSPPLVVLISTRDVEDFGSRLANAPVAGFLPKHAISVDAIEDLIESYRAGAR